MLILCSFLAHRFDGQSSFGVHFQFIGSMSKAHLEVISEFFRRHGRFICGSLVGNQVFYHVASADC